MRHAVAKSRSHRRTFDSPRTLAQYGRRHAIPPGHRARRRRHVHRRDAGRPRHRRRVDHEDANDAPRSGRRLPGRRRQGARAWPARVRESLGQVLHGTTTATNAILEAKGVRTGLLTTAGFRYVLEIGRHDIPRRANMFAWVKPARPVPPELIVEIPERVDRGRRGARAARRGRRCGRPRAGCARPAWIRSPCASCTPTPIRRTSARRARSCWRSIPGARCRCRSEVLPVFREYERTMATVLNAYVQPLVGSLRGHARGAAARPRGGGAAVDHEVQRRRGRRRGRAPAGHPHRALSGPAAGVIGARLVGEAAGFPDVISVDVGGTSADVCLIRGGEAQVTTEGTHRGLAAAACR